MSFIVGGLTFVGQALMKFRPMEPKSHVSKKGEPSLFSLFKSPPFTLYFFMGFTLAFGLIVPAFYASVYAKSIGLSDTEGALFAGLYNLASGLGRLAIGLSADLSVGRVNAYILCLSLFGTSVVLIWPFASTFATFCAFILISGFVGGGGQVRFVFIVPLECQDDPMIDNPIES